MTTELVVAWALYYSMSSNPAHRGAEEILRKKAASIVGAARSLGLTVVTVESCTAGRVASALIDAPNASDVVHGGFVTYTKECKEALGVPSDAIRRYTPVSEEVARELALCALNRSPADIAIAVTGVVGPTTDEDNNPVGLIYFAAARRGLPTEVVRKDFGGLDRDAMLINAIEEALDLLDHMVGSEQVVASV
jgi:nicotinamide-nucleotide amidase